MKCRHCQTDLSLKFLDLGYAPPSNDYLSADDLNKPEVTYPLRVLTCTNCWLVQTEDYAAHDDLFREDYAYFSSTSKGWLAHAERYCLQMTQRLGLNEKSFVVELASNDGYLLKNFVANGVPCLGVEPTRSTAEAAKALGIPVVEDFFGAKLGRKLAQEGPKADLILGNNVYAHVPDINDFTQGVAELLADEGVVTFEFPHLGQLVKHNQFDTVYHEHFSYLALHPVISIFKAAGLRVFDVEELPTHGGSLRVFGCLSSASHLATENVARVMSQEIEAGLLKEDTYRGFQGRAEKVKNGLLRFLLDAKAEGKTVVGYGAAAKGNTLLNFCGVGPDLLPFISDAAPSKIGKFMPGSHIPIKAPAALTAAQPDYVLILPWNIADEVMSQNKDLAQNGSTFVIAVPELKFI